jgi:hypothetical protein
MELDSPMRPTYRTTYSKRVLDRAEQADRGSAVTAIVHRENVPSLKLCDRNRMVIERPYAEDDQYVLRIGLLSPNG